MASAPQSTPTAPSSSNKKGPVCLIVIGMAVILLI